MIRVLRVLPDELNVHGDAENALVLARRAEWSGVEASVVDARDGEPLPGFRPDAVVVGSGTDPALVRHAALLAPLADSLRGWAADGVPLLAVGTGFELLTDEIRTGAEVLAGIGIFPATVAPLPARATGDLVVRARSLVVGFENHARGVQLADGAVPYGDVASGVGNSGGIEGCLADGALGTHLHGPLLARNPDLADDLLSRMLGAAYDPGNPSARAADQLAATSRARTLTALGIRS
ncbi:type 1 glutamine amidotransferase [Lysobacter korlensis]|uniref:Lipid II isoglutaminyl synthase (glutamine-hydrolyzing) subunit GatD n=1 Tax=Lysobacter korlensis TaxID=553636 RepID=A0ABV6RNY3_9GAMM